MNCKFRNNIIISLSICLKNIFEFVCVFSCVYVVHIPDMPTSTVPQLPNSLKTISSKTEEYLFSFFYFILLRQASFFLRLYCLYPCWRSICSTENNICAKTENGISFLRKWYLRSGGDGISFLLCSQDLWEAI